MTERGVKLHSERTARLTADDYDVLSRRTREVFSRHSRGRRLFAREARFRRAGVAENAENAKRLTESVLPRCYAAITLSIYRDVDSRD